MPFSVTEFQSNLNRKNGLAKPSLFEVYIPVRSVQVARDLTLQCESAEFTGKTLQTADHKIYGPTFKVPYQTAYQEITLTFLCTNTFYERQLFEDWLQAIMPSATNNLRFPKEPGSGYVTDIFIYQYNEAGQRIMTMQLYEAFPISIGSQSLSWGEDGFHRLPVQFTFMKYETYLDQDTNRIM